MKTHLLVDSEMRNGKLQKLEVVFDSIKCEANLNVAFGFVIKDVENGSGK